MGRVVSVVVLVLVAFCFYTYWEHNRLSAEQPPLMEQSDRDLDKTFDAHMKDCDRLCKYYDTTGDPHACERLRSECDLPCQVGKVFLDVVFLWANGSEPVYASESDRIRKSLAGHPEWMACFKQATETKRARDLGTFRYAIRALFDKFEPLRRIFIITPLGQVPTFLVARHKRIRMVDTRSLVPIADPSFNSNAVQFQMHRIPTLSDPFITMNDDFLMLKNQPLDTFVHPVSRQVRYPVDYFPANAMIGCWGAMMSTSNKMWEDHFDRGGTHPTLYVAAHQPLAVSHSVARFIAHRWREKLRNVTNHVFRNSRDPTFDSFHIWVGTALSMGLVDSLEYECRGTLALNSLTKTDSVITALISPKTCNSLALNDDIDGDTPVKLLANVDVILEHLYPKPSPVEIPSGPNLRELIEYDCTFSREEVEVPVRGFYLPKVLDAIHYTWRTRQRTGWNRQNKTAAQLYSEYRELSLVFGDQEVTGRALGPRNSLRATQWVADRGASWCELSIHLRFHAALKHTDFFFISNLDLGMARSRNVYAARRLAFAIGYNYVFAPEFYECSRGSVYEEVENWYLTNNWGLHGNAILSPWKLRNGTVVKFPNGLDVFNPPNQELEGERRIGGRHALCAEAEVPFEDGTQVKTTVCVMESNHLFPLGSDHGRAVVKLLQQRISAYGNQAVIIGGTFWPHLCEALGLESLLKEPVGLAFVDDDGIAALGAKTRNNHICVRHWKAMEPVSQYVGSYLNRRKGTTDPFSADRKCCIFLFLFSSPAFHTFGLT